MGKYCEREMIKKCILEEYPLLERDRLRRTLDDIPAADVRPVKRGRWEEDFAGAAICSVCNEYAFETSTHHLCGWFPSFCPNCGADMRQCPEDEAAEEMASVRWLPRREEI